jgi:diaminopimelate epimerase
MQHGRRQSRSGLPSPFPFVRLTYGAMNQRPFVKMHGLGNDFVVIDARRQPLTVSAAGVRALADRRTGIGFDQLITIEPPRNAAADAFMRIRNADGGEVEACGNAARCVAQRLMADAGATTVTLETVAGLLRAEAMGDHRVAVDMGPAGCDWRDIPLAEPVDTAHLPLAVGGLADGVAVSIGNPHAVFFVDDVAAVDLGLVGPTIEHHPLFPRRTNVEVVQVLTEGHLRLRVWERGVGITRACGTGACAAAVAAHRRGLAGRAVTITLDGGDLAITWRADDHVVMAGPATTTFAGTLDPSWQM